MKALELKIPPLIVMAVAGLIALAVAIPLAEESGVLLFSDPALLSASVVALILGAYVAVSGVVEFRKHQTTVNPMQADDASSLVTTGIYQKTRNPMYVGFVLILASWCLALGVMQTLWVLPVFALYINELQIKPEEKILVEKFPQEFAAYTENVGRWWGRSV